MTNLVEFDFREMVSVSDDEVVTTSQQIAKFFKREHKNILRAIEKLECSAEFARLNYELCFGNNELQNGKPNKFYRMTKDGMIFLVMGFTGKTAAGIKEKYILAFNSMYAAIQSIRQSGLIAFNQLEIKKAKSSERGRFGSLLMNQRKKEKRLLANEETRLINLYQYQLPLIE